MALKPNDAPAASSVMVEVGSPEFNDAVARSVAAVLAAQPAAEAPRQIITQAPAIVQQTSIDRSSGGPDDITVQFQRFCTFQNSGYQNGQQAGFPRRAAEDLARGGSAFIVHDPRYVARYAA